MSILKILQYPDLRLRTKGYQVTDVKSPNIQKIIDDIIETLANEENCAGLAATQLDIEQPPNITVINTPDILCLINLEITDSEGSSIENEGCMSVRPQDIHAELERATKITVSALDRDGNKLLFAATDFLARCIQHEYDHLEGILFIDKIKSKEYLGFREEIDKLRKDPVLD